VSYKSIVVQVTNLIRVKWHYLLGGTIVWKDKKTAEAFPILFVCSLRKKDYFPFCQLFSVKSPYTLPILCKPCQVRLSLISFLNGTTCDFSNVHDSSDVQGERHIHFHCTHPHVVSLRRTYASLFPQASTMFLLFWARKTKKLSFFLHGLIVFLWAG